LCYNLAGLIEVQWDLLRSGRSSSALLPDRRTKRRVCGERWGPRRCECWSAAVAVWRL